MTYLRTFEYWQNIQTVFLPTVYAVHLIYHVSMLESTAPSSIPNCSEEPLPPVEVDGNLETGLPLLLQESTALSSISNHSEEPPPPVEIGDLETGLLSSLQTPLSGLLVWI